MLWDKGLPRTDGIEEVFCPVFCNRVDVFRPDWLIAELGSMIFEGDGWGATGAADDGTKEAELLDGKNPSEEDPYFACYGSRKVSRNWIVLRSPFRLNSFWHPSGCHFAVESFRQHADKTPCCDGPLNKLRETWAVTGCCCSLDSTSFVFMCQPSLFHCCR